MSSGNAATPAEYPPAHNAAAETASAQITAMRALAHPTRAQILELLRERSSMTATECAAALHLTPKTCSYHLLTLASSGLIEEIPVPGRNRPWHLTEAGARRAAGVGASDATTVSAPVEAADRARRVRTRREESLLDTAATALAAAPPAWTEAAVVHTRVARMTPAEVAAWAAEVERITTRYVRRPAPIGTDGDRVEVALLFCGYPSP